MKRGSRMAACLGVVAGLGLAGTAEAACTGAARHGCKVRDHAPAGAGSLTVVSGSSIKITPYGEVLTPPISVISVNESAVSAPPSPDRPLPSRNRANDPMGGNPAPTPAPTPVPPPKP